MWKQEGGPRTDISSPVSSPQLLLVSFPRNGHVDRTVGRQHRNEDRIACHGAVEVNKSQYDFVALVEHLPSGRLNVEGHFCDLGEAR